MTALKVKQISILTALIVMAFFSVYLFAEAEENSSTTSATSTNETGVEQRQTLLEEKQAERTQAIEDRQNLRIERIEDRQIIRDERQTALTELRQQRIINLSANISNRMDAAIERLFNLVGRLEERITILKQTGVNTEPAEAKLREAAQLLSEARAKLANIDSLVVNATTATEPKSAWKNVKQAYQDASSLIRNSHQALRETISLLKSSIGEKEQNRNTLEMNTQEHASSTVTE